MDTTVLIPPNARARVDSRLNLVVEVDAAASRRAALAAVELTNRGA
jgi:hypothetical protein